MTESNNLDPRFTLAVFRYINLWSNVDNLRIVAEAGVSQAKTVLEEANINFMKRVLSDPQFNEMFVNKDEFIKTMGMQAGTIMTEKMLSIAAISRDAASVVFAHSILDAFLFVLCKIGFDADPQSIEKFIEKRQISYKAARDKTTEQVRQELLGNYLSALERESLLRKCDVLYQQCNPKAGFSGVANYEFDQTKLSAFDELRHDIVHGLRIDRPINNIEDQLEYARNTGFHFMAMLNSRYELKLNAAVLLESFAAK